MEEVAVVSMWSIRCSSWGGVALVVTLRVRCAVFSCW